MAKIPLLLLFLGHVWVDCSQGIFPVVAVKLKDLFELSYFQVGLMMMVLNISSSVIQPIFGFLSDRFRTGWFVPVGVLWTAIAMGLIGWAPHYWVAVTLVGLAGLGTAAFHPRAMMAVYHVSGNRRGFGAAVFATGGNVGFAVGPMLGSLLILGFGLHATLSLVPVGLLLFLFIIFYPGDYLRHDPTPPAASTATASVVETAIPWISLIAVCLIVTFRSWVYMSFITYLPMFFQQQGIQLKTGSLMLTVFLACGAAAGLYGGHLSDRLGRVRVTASTLLLYPFLAAMMLLSKGIWIWVFADASGAALLASFSITVVMAQELLPRHLGVASGLVLGLGFGTGGLGTALSGYLADHIGLYATFWILAAFPLLAAAMAFLIKMPATEPITSAR